MIPPEFPRPLAIDRVGIKEKSFDIAATSAECINLARRLGIPEVLGKPQRELQESPIYGFHLDRNRPRIGSLGRIGKSGHACDFFHALRPARCAADPPPGVRRGIG